MAKAKSKPGSYPPAEADKRRDDALRAALKTQPRRHPESDGSKQNTKKKGDKR